MTTMNEERAAGLTAMSDLPKRLRIKASMIALGERIAWGSDTAIMEEAAEVIEALSGALDGMLEVYGGERDANGRPKHEVELNLIAIARAALAASTGQEVEK